jgi:cytochrome c553
MDAGTEPIGERIVEVAEYPELTALRAPNAGYVAYAPVGSIKKGEALVARGQCVSCHGRDLGGNAPGAPRVKLGPLAPPLAGRSPTYIVRQLFMMQNGDRTGPSAAEMQPAVEKLRVDDMLAIAAYVASREP